MKHHLFLGAGVAILAAAALQAQTYRALYTFKGLAKGNSPTGNLLLAGNTLYGTTELGGSTSCTFEPQECGVIYRVNAKTGKQAVLHRFTGPDGVDPIAGGLIRDSSGNLYGVANCGGTVPGQPEDACTGLGGGTLFKIDKSGVFTVLHNFDCAVADGCALYGVLAMDAQGDLYGTASAGGPYYPGGPFGGGSVYKYDTAGNFTVLHSFGAVGDGSNPFSGVLLENGMLYGTTWEGGASNQGTVFMVDATSGAETVLYSFTGGADGGTPGYGNLVTDGAGKLYGTAEYGGSLKTPLTDGGGVVFQFNTNTGTETVLHTFANGSFTGPSNGCNPTAGLTRDARGNLYGTTAASVTTGAHPFCSFAEGTVFKLDLTGTLTVLHAYSGTQRDLGGVDGGVTRDSKGNLYGTVEAGGAGHSGVVFEIVP